MSTPSLPAYSHADTPSYTAFSRGDEQTLQLANINRMRRPVPSRSLRDWTKKSGNATLTLRGQPVDSHLPLYGRCTTIDGFVTLDSTEGVATVQIKLTGHVKGKTISEIGGSDVNILNTVVTLWRQGNSPCPTLLPFELPLSTTYTWGDQTGPLPPSFEYTFYDVQGGTPGLRAKVIYKISVELEPAHPSLMDRFTSSLSTPLVYLPRARPGRPPSNAPTTVFESIMEHRLGGKSKDADPIVWKLRLPPPGTFAITQPIPFRVTVTSRSSSRIMPFGPTSKKEKASIRVYALRRISIKVKTIDLWRSFVIGEGKLTYIPQNIDDGMWLKNVPVTPTDGKSRSVGSGESVASLPEREGWAAHDWSGVLNIDSTQVTVGGFQVGEMVVKDFIVLSVIPPNPHLGSLLEARLAVPIQLTTDGWVDVGQAPTGNLFIDHVNVSRDPHGYLEGIGDYHHAEDVDGHRQNGKNGSGVYFTNGNGMPRNGDGV